MTLQAHQQSCEPHLWAAFLSLRAAHAYLQTDPVRFEQAIASFWKSITCYYEEIARFPTFSCRNRCSHCCHDNPHGISGLEIRRIAQRLLHHPQAERIQQELRERLVQYHQLDPPADQSKQLHWKRQGHPCVFLQADSCSIYECRPLACQSFFALSPSSLCQATHPQHHQAVHPQFVGSSEFHALLFDISAQLGLELPDDLISGLSQYLEEMQP